MVADRSALCRNTALFPERSFARPPKRDSSSLRRALDRHAAVSEVGVSTFSIARSCDHLLHHFGASFSGFPPPSTTWCATSDSHRVYLSRLCCPLAVSHDLEALLQSHTRGSVSRRCHPWDSLHSARLRCTRISPHGAAAHRRLRSLRQDRVAAFLPSLPSPPTRSF